jgi:hypothetical protein
MIINTDWDIPEITSLNDLHRDNITDAADGFSPSEALERSRVDFTKELEPPQWVISVVGSDGTTRRFATLGNFSVIQGKAKSRKSTLTTLLMAASLSGKGLSAFESSLPEGKRKVILYDTEQDEYDVRKTCDSVRRLIQRKPEAWDNFTAYALRPLSTDERLQAIEHHLCNTQGIGVAVIDGIRDLVKDFNDLNQTADLISALLRWTSDYKIHIVIVIHTNKGDGNARGHLGSELMNKAETAVSVTKDTANEQVSFCKPEFTRGREFDPFAFRYGDTGLPEIVSGWTLASKAGRFSKPEPQLYELESKIGEIFKSDAVDGIPRSALRPRLQSVFNNAYEIGEKKADKLIRIMVDGELIRTSGTEGTRQCRYHPFHVSEPDQTP